MTERKFTRPDQAPEGHEWKTSDGLKVKLCREINEDAERPIVGWVYQENWRVTASRWLIDGSYMNIGSSIFDLVDVPKVYEAWLNIHTCGRSFLYDTRTNADESSTPTRIACIPVKYTEGEGL